MRRADTARRLRMVGHLLAVVDDPADAPAAVAALRAAGVEPNAVTLLRGAEGATRIDATGAAAGIRARLRQALSFTLVDQMPDLVVYEAAVLEGRAVLAVPVASDDAKLAIRDILRRHGAHFMNVYGRFATEEIDLWRGPELTVPGYLRR